MPSYSLSGAPTVVDGGASTSIAITNTGTVPVLVQPGGVQVAPGGSVTRPGWSQVATTLQTAGQAGSADATLTAGSPAARPGPGPVLFDASGIGPVSVTISGGSWFTNEGLTTAATFPLIVSTTATLYPAAPASVTITGTAGGVSKSLGMNVSDGSSEVFRFGDLFASGTGSTSTTEILRAGTPGVGGGTFAPLTVVRATSRKADTWVLVGDSITQRATNKAYWAYARSFLKNRIRLISNAAVGGTKTATMLSTWDATVTTTNAGWVHILGGTNDLDGSLSTAGHVAQTTGNIAAMLDLADRDGMRAIVGTIIPQTGRSAGMKDAQSQINRWIRALPKTRNVLVADYELAIADPTTGDPIADLLNDSTHPGVSGAARMGRVLAAVFAPFLVSAPELLNQEADPGNIALRGRFSGAGVGAVPTSWFETGASGGARTYSKVARTDGVGGSWQRLVVPTGGAVMLAQNITIGATLAVGESVNFRVEYRASALDALTSGQYFFAQLGAYNGSTFTTTVYDIQYGSGNENQIPFDREGMFLTDTLTVPSGTTLVQFGLMIGGGGTYDLDRASVQKV